jgi:hypothetical protein
MAFFKLYSVGSGGKDPLKPRDNFRMFLKSIGVTRYAEITCGASCSQNAPMFVFESELDKTKLIAVASPYMGWTQGLTVSEASPRSLDRQV